MQLQLGNALERPADFGTACEFFQLVAARYYPSSNRSTQAAIYMDAMRILQITGGRYCSMIQQRAALRALQVVERLMLCPRLVQLPDGSTKDTRSPKDIVERIPKLQSGLREFESSFREAEARTVSMDAEEDIDPMHGWQHLPPELLYEVFSFLQLRDLLTVNSVCKFWKYVSRDDSLYRRHFLAMRRRLGIDGAGWTGGWREGLAAAGAVGGTGLLLTDLVTVEWVASRSRTKGQLISAAEALDHIVTKF